VQTDSSEETFMLVKKNSFPRPPTPARIAHKLTQQLTRNLPGIIKRLPEPPFILQKKIAEKLLENLLAEQIEMGDFDFLEDKWLKLNINDMGLSFFFTFLDDKLLLCEPVKQVDVSFSGDASDFILLASRSEDPDTLFFQRRLMIEGDTELGLYIKNSIDGIDFDNWPAWLNSTIKKIAALVSEVDNSNSPSPH